MRVDFIEEPDAVERYAVIHPETEEEYEHVAWADDERGIVAVFVTRPRTLADREGADLRLRRPDRSFQVEVCHVPVKIARRDDHPLKSAFFELLQDPDVREEIARIMRSAFLGIDRAAVMAMIRRDVAREINDVMARQAALARAKREIAED